MTHAQASAFGDSVEQQITQWRAYLHHRQALHTVDVEELEDHLRDQVATLVDSGLAADESFLVAVKRLGNLDAISREFALEHAERLWKQLVVFPERREAPDSAPFNEAVVVLGLAALAAVAFKVPEVFGRALLRSGAGFYARNFCLFVLPLLTGYFGWKRHLAAHVRAWLVLPFAAAVTFANAFPFADGGDTERLTALHLPIALWLAVGIAYAGANWSRSRRMDFVRFSGELFIYYALIAFGGGVLTAFTVTMFAAIGFNVVWLALGWLLPCGALGAVLVGAWLVEAKQSVIENMAPVLTRVFTPLCTVLLLAFLATMAWTGRGIDVARNVLIGFDLLLALVLGLVLYAASARDALAPPNAFDALQVLLIGCALVVDLVTLTAIGARISEFGFSANKLAALGENIILLVNLTWSAYLYVRFLRGQGSFNTLERWLTEYLLVYAVWAAIVVVVFPPLFHYV